MEDTQEVNGSAHKRKPVWPWLVLSLIVCIQYSHEVDVLFLSHTTPNGLVLEF